MNRQLLLIGMLGLSLVLETNCRAQQQPAPQTSDQSTPPEAQSPAERNHSPDQLPMSTAAFVQKVAEDNRMAVEMARLATTRGQLSEVKDYAQQLMKDHMDSGNTLQSYASKHNITLPQDRISTLPPGSAPTPSNMPPRGLAAADDAIPWELSSKTGPEFDQAYIHMLVQDHRKAVALFEAQQQAKDMDSEILGFINNTLPVLRKHLSMAEALEKTIPSRL